MEETIGKILLIIACLYLAGLNLWLEFKAWFNGKYQKREDSQITSEKKVPRVGKSKTVASIIGESKFKLPSKIAEEENNKPFHSEPIRKKDELVEPKEEFIPLQTQKNNPIDVELQSNQSMSVDEFEMMAKSLSGQLVSANEQKQIKNTVEKIKGTQLFEQFLKQVKGAEEIANKIMQGSEPHSNTVENGGFDFDRYIQK